MVKNIIIVSFLSLVFFIINYRIQILIGSENNI